MSEAKKTPEAAKSAPAQVPAKIDPKASTALSSASNDAFAGLKLGGGLEIAEVKVVTRPILRQEDGVPFAVTFLKAAYQGEALKGRQKKPVEGEAAKPEMEPARLFHVLNLQTGEEQTLIANAALESGLDASYPDGGYVGLSFGIVSRRVPHKGTRMIREYMIKELVLRKAV